MSVVVYQVNKVIRLHCDHDRLQGQQGHQASLVTISSTRPGLALFVAGLKTNSTNLRNVNLHGLCFCFNAVISDVCDYQADMIIFFHVWAI